MIRKLYIFIGALGALAAAATFSFAALNSPRGEGSHRVDFQVAKGEGTISIAHHLEKEGLIHNALFFRLITRISGNEGRLQRGLYPLDDAMSSSQILASLTSGKTKTVRVTIPEGFNNRQIGDLLHEAGLLSSREEFLAAAADTNLLAKYKIPAESLEGYLFPETYHIPVGFSAVQMVELMHATFLERVKTLENFPTTPEKIHRVIILSSIVEREAQKKEERPLIAGVFANRLGENYPLESCATIQYLFEKPKKRLYFKDLEIQSPYNTYIHAGLPPGPISNPGMAAIEATLKPVDTKYKFFVVKPDGSHHFSESFQEHVRAKNKYIGK